MRLDLMLLDINICLHVLFQGSLRKHLHENSIDWMSALKLCLALSQGLAYLHSDLHREGVCLSFSVVSIWRYMMYNYIALQFRCDA